MPRPRPLPKRRPRPRTGPRPFDSVTDGFLPIRLSRPARPGRARMAPPATGGPGAISVTRLAAWMYGYRIRRGHGQTLPGLGAGAPCAVVRPVAAAQARGRG